MWLVSALLYDYSWEVIECNSNEEAKALADSISMDIEYRKTFISKVTISQINIPGTFSYRKKFY